MNEKPKENRERKSNKIKSFFLWGGIKNKIKKEREMSNKQEEGRKKKERENYKKMTF